MSVSGESVNSVSTVWYRATWFYLLLTVLGSFLVMLPFLFLYSVPENDVSERYIPIVQAGLDGRWDLAFHPRVPPAFPLWAMSIAWIGGFTPFVACKIASLLAFCLGVIPLFFMLRNVFSTRVAWWGVFAYLLCSYLGKLSFAGLRETFTAVGLLCLGCGITGLFRSGGIARYWVALMIGSIILGLTRIDSLIFMCAIWGLLFASLIFIRAMRSRWRGLFLSFGVFMLPLMAWIGYCWSVTGCPVPDARLIAKVEKILPGVFKKRQGTLAANDLSQKESAPHLSSVLSSFQPEAQQNRSWLEHLLKGLYLYFLVFAIPVIVWRIGKRQWSHAETVLLGLTILYPLLLVTEIAMFSGLREIDRRYLLPGVPLYLGWTVLALQALYGRFCTNRRWLGGAVLVILVISSLMDSTWDAIKMNGVSKRKTRACSAIHAVKDWLRANLPPAHYVDPVPFSIDDYHSGRAPVVYTSFPAVASLSGYCPKAPQWAAVLMSPGETAFLVLSNKELEGRTLPYQKRYSTGDSPQDLTVFQIHYNKPTE